MFTLSNRGFVASLFLLISWYSPAFNNPGVDRIVAELSELIDSQEIFAERKDGRCAGLVEGLLMMLNRSKPEEFPIKQTLDLLRTVSSAMANEINPQADELSLWHSRQAFSIIYSCFTFFYNSFKKAKESDEPAAGAILMRLALENSLRALETLVENIGPGSHIDHRDFCRVLSRIHTMAATIVPAALQEFLPLLTDALGRASSTGEQAGAHYMTLFAIYEELPPALQEIAYACLPAAEAQLLPELERDAQQWAEESNPGALRRCPAYAELRGHIRALNAAIKKFKAPFRDEN